MSHRSGWLFVLPWEPTAIGGVSRVVNELASSLAHGSTFDPCILVLDWNSHPKLADETDDIPIIRLKIRTPGPTFSRQRLAYWLFWPMVALALRRLLAERRVIVVNPHYPTESAMELLRTIEMISPSIKSIVSFHGTDVGHLARLDKANRLRWAHELNAKTAVTCCSNGLRERLQAFLQIPLANSCVKRNGVSRLDYPNALASHVYERSRVLSIGTYHENKAHDILVRAFRLIADEFPTLDLVVVGRSGPAFAEVDELVQCLGLRQRVTLKTNVDMNDMGPLYEGVSLFVSASRFEPFGLAILEAGAAHLPVVATDTDGARDILENGVDSIVVPIDEPHAMAKAIRSLLVDKSLSDRLSQNLHSKVLRDYRWDTIATGWEALVRTV